MRQPQPRCTSGSVLGAHPAPEGSGIAVPQAAWADAGKPKCHLRVPPAAVTLRVATFGSPVPGEGARRLQEAAVPSGGPRQEREREPGPVLDVGNMNDWQRKSPLDWETYVNKLVKVVAVEKHEYEGWVLTVDPVSATIVLATFPENEKGSISFIMGHAIQEVEILREGDSDMKQRLARISAPEERQAYSPEELEKRRKALKSWLETNHIPVGEQGEQGRTLSVAGVLTIEPPYGPEQCSSANEIILSRVQDLLHGYLGQQRPGPAQEPFCL